MKLQDRYIHLLIGITMLFVFSACNTTKYLGENEFLLDENEIIFLDDSKVSKGFGNKSALKTILLQQPQHKIFWRQARMAIPSFNQKKTWQLAEQLDG